MSLLQNLKKQSAQIAKENAFLINQEASPQKYSDDRFWTLTVDKKTQNGLAEIRFLPRPPEEKFPFVKFYDHGFKNDDGFRDDLTGQVYWEPTNEWYIEKSLNTLGEADPVGELAQMLWKGQGVFSTVNQKRREDVARKFKRRTYYISNILVVNDPEHPENNGKVFLFKYGPEIFEKLCDVSKKEGKLEDDPYLEDPFCFWNGGNFRIRSSSRSDKGGFRTYEKSVFLKQSNLENILGAARLEEILNELNSLEDLLKPENFKSYAELSMKLTKVLGRPVSSFKGGQQSSYTENTFPFQTHGGGVFKSEDKVIPGYNTASELKPVSSMPPKGQVNQFDPETDGDDILKALQDALEE